MKVLIVATRNAHKVEEMAAVLEGKIQCRGLSEFEGVPEAVEDGLTFRDNAAKKCLAVARWLAGRPELVRKVSGSAKFGVLADDSGLEVDALQGAPGIYSARFAGLDQPGSMGNSPDAENNRKLLRLLAEVALPGRSARFRCALALATVGEGEVAPSLRFCEGVCEGRILLEPTGGGGFGYDPLFVPAGENASFAQLGSAVKNRISHRSRALAQLRAQLGLD